MSGGTTKDETFDYWCKILTYPKNKITSTNLTKRIVITKKLDTTFISVMHPICYSLDVHKNQG